MDLLEEFQDVFTDVPGLTTFGEHSICLTTDEPIHSKPYPIPHAMQDTVDKEIETNLLKLSDHDLTITVTSDTIQPVNSVRDLGVKLDSKLSMKQQVSNITRACFYHLRRLRQIRCRAGYEVTVRL